MGDTRDFVIEARIHELRDGGFLGGFSLEEHDGRGVTETQFFVPNTFPTQKTAIDAATQAGRSKIDMGFTPNLTQTPYRAGS